MRKVMIRWLFWIAMLGFLAAMKYSGTLYRNQNLFLILLLIVSGIVVAGVIYFRDGVMTEADEEPEPESAALLKELIEDEAIADAVDAAENVDKAMDDGGDTAGI